GSTSFTTDLLRLMPNNLALSSSGALTPARRRGMLTTHSFDVDRPGMTPYVWNPSFATDTDPSATQYTAATLGSLPQANPVSFQSLVARVQNAFPVAAGSQNVAPGSDYQAIRATIAPTPPAAPPGATENGNTVTITCTRHGLAVGDLVVIK